MSGSGSPCHNSPCRPDLGTNRVTEAQMMQIFPYHVLAVPARLFLQVLWCRRVESYALKSRREDSLVFSDSGTGWLFLAQVP